MGNSKIKPDASTEALRRPIQLFKSKSLKTSELIVQFPKKFIESGVTMQYPNKTPIKNNVDEIKIKPLAPSFSFLYSPGLINFQNSYTTYGNARMNPASIDVQR